MPRKHPHSSGEDSRPFARRGSRRCAIYTRKSTEEGLDQAFNSRDAQRGACEAYIESQRHEGWQALPALYDDGGFSGGSLERPALQQLLEDIRNGGVDVVVVYKVDRLTRSLADFAKIIEIFDAGGVSFVSVTQAFNTTNSMGRLTLNVLLSFAQFEREVTGERIRDKIAASKKKGMWMGGLPPLGYDVSDRKLVVNETEAETVRAIFRRYCVVRSVQHLKDALDAEGIVSKVRTDRHGRETGAKPFAHGALYHLLQNPIYQGLIRHKDKTYPGEHSPIIDEDLWSKTQETLAANRQDRRSQSSVAGPSLLAGLLFDEEGKRLVPTHAKKGGRRYRYYASTSLIRRRSGAGESTTDDRQTETNPRTGWRLPASDLETLVETRLTGFLGDRGAVIEALDRLDIEPQMKPAIIDRTADCSARWPRLSQSERCALLQNYVLRIIVSDRRVDLVVCAEALVNNDEQTQRRRSGAKTSSLSLGDQDPESSITLSIAARLQRAGIEMRLLVNGAEHRPAPEPDRNLLRLLVMAARFRDQLICANGRSITELARDAGVSPSYFTRVVRLGFIAPSLVRRIAEGGQHPGLTAKRLIRADLASDWEKQQAALG